MRVCVLLPCLQHFLYGLRKLPPSLLCALGHACPNNRQQSSFHQCSTLADCTNSPHPPLHASPRPYHILLFVVLCSFKLTAVALPVPCNMAACLSATFNEGKWVTSLDGFDIMKPPGVIALKWKSAPVSMPRT